MNRGTLALALLLSFFSLIGADAQQRSGLRGVWQLVEIIPAGTASGSIPQPGQYIFTDRHYSFARITAEEPRQLVGRAEFPAMTADQLRDVVQFVGESGTYEIKGSDLVIRRTVAFIPANMVSNNAASFSFEVRGDTLTLTPRTRVDGTLLRNNAALKFRRIE